MNREKETLLKGYVSVENDVSDFNDLASIQLKNAVNILEITEADKIPATEYTQYADIYNSPDELPDKYKSIIKEKLKTQHLNENAAGLYFYPNSTLAQSIVKSTELKNKIKEYVKNLYPNNNKNVNKSDEIRKEVHNEINK